MSINNRLLLGVLCASVLVVSVASRAAPPSAVSAIAERVLGAESKDKTKKPKKEKKPKKRTGFEIGLSAQTLGKKDLTLTEKELELDIDLRPKLMGKFGFGDHDLALTYNPRLLLPAMGPKQGDFDHLHRMRLDWKGKFGKGVKVKFRQDFEVGLRDFKTTVPSIDSGVPDEDAEDESVGDDAEAEVEEEADEEEAEEEEAESEESEEESEEGDEDDAGEDELIEETEEDLLEERLTLIEKVFLLKSVTDFGMEFAVAKKHKVGFGVKFTRSGAIEERAKVAFPERLNPAGNVFASISLGKSDKLLSKVAFEYSAFSNDNTSMIGNASLGWQHVLFGKSKLTLSAGFGGAGFETKTLEQAFLLPYTGLDFAFAFKPEKNTVQLTLGTALQGYTASSTGVVTPRVGGKFGLGWKNKNGLFLKSSSSVISNLTPQDYDPQGYTFVVDGKFGWAFSPYFSVEVGSMFQRNQKPDRKGKTFEPADRLEFFLTLTGSSGLLP
ncbi:MAG: hypothetical protein IV100_07975 [Myxococcales bacterium]|nr:hypothetical protein [Myxococcales bacterium]